MEFDLGQGQGRADRERDSQPAQEPAVAERPEHARAAGARRSPVPSAPGEVLERSMKPRRLASRGSAG